jgi:hypothetical protein
MAVAAGVMGGKQQQQQQLLPAHLAKLLSAKSKHAQGAVEEDRLLSLRALDRLEHKDVLEAEREKVTEDRVRAYRCDQVSAKMRMMVIGEGWVLKSGW